MTKRSLRHTAPKVKLALLTPIVLVLGWLGGTCLDKAFHDFSANGRMLATVAELMAGAAVGALAILCAVEFAVMYQRWVFVQNRQDWQRCANPDCDEVLERPYVHNSEAARTVCMDCEKDFIRRAARLAGGPA